MGIHGPSSSAVRICSHDSATFRAGDCNMKMKLASTLAITEPTPCTPEVPTLEVAFRCMIDARIRATSRQIENVLGQLISLAAGRVLSGKRGLSWRGIFVLQTKQRNSFYPRF